MLKVHGSSYAQTILYYNEPQQHGTGITNINNCNVTGYCNINEHSIPRYIQSCSELSCCSLKEFWSRNKALSAAADEDSNSKILVAST